MAQAEVTGGTVQELAELQHEYEQSPKYIETGVSFETSYCLNEIGKQPDEYDGPTRYCTNRVSRTDDGGHAYTCRFHGSITPENIQEDNLEKPGIAALKHGMYATDEHLKEAFTESDQQLYDFIMSWAEAYGWPDKSEDPARYDLLEQLAVARVRAARSEKYVLETGEIEATEVFDPETGQVNEIEQENKLTEAIRLQRKLIIDLMKELGLTPKEQSRMGAEEQTANAAEQLAEVASKAVLDDPNDGDETGFDPDDPMFEEEADA